MRKKTPIGLALLKANRLMANESRKDEITNAFLELYQVIETLQIDECKAIWNAYSEGWRKGLENDIHQSPNDYYKKTFDGLTL